MAARLGLFGGTFDPIHTGHLVVAETVRDVLELDEVWFIPANTPPHKAAPAIPAVERAAMVERAVADHPAFRLSRVDLDRPGPSFAEDTIETIRAARPGDDLFYIIGADMLRELHTWRHPDRLVTLAQFVAVTRPGESLAESASPVAERVVRVEMPPLAISSTDIRARVAAGRSIRYLVPAPVAAYISQHQLYRPVSV